MGETSESDLSGVVKGEVLKQIIQQIYMTYANKFYSLFKRYLLHYVLDTDYVLGTKWQIKMVRTAAVLWK